MATKRSLQEMANQVPALERLCPQQIVCRTTDGTQPTPSALVDQWGRAHRLAHTTVLGRELADNDVAILDGSVSRNHAEVRLDGQQWVVEDHGSTNGTFVAGARIEAPTAISDGALVVLGEVGFTFVQNVDAFVHHSRESIKQTAPTREQSENVLLLMGQAASGGGVVEYEGHYIQMGPSQYVMVELLAKRWLAEPDQSEAVRGFVRAVELLHEIPWGTAYPDDNNVKQLVRRIRRAFERVGVADPIESRYGFGYRLTIPPRIQNN